MSALRYYILYTVPPFVVWGVFLGGVWTWLPLGIVFVMIPILDVLSGLDRHNPDAAEEARRERSWLYRASLWLMAPVMTGMIAFVLFAFVNWEYSTVERVGMLLSLGVMVSAGSINVAHELMHKKGAVDRGLAEYLMSLASYPWFCIEHVFGHHMNVATPEDPATARKGENAYGFTVRSILGGMRSAWNLETARCERRGIRAWSLRDRRFRQPLVLLAMYGVVFGFFGWLGVFAFAVQSAVAVFQLEVINYIEHYGLMRRETAPGKYETVQPRHSWNSSHRLTSWFLFNLPRHSDHHALASRAYWGLRHYDEAPQLPAGYPTMVLTALVPPLWFRVIDPLLDSWKELEERELAQAATA